MAKLILNKFIIHELVRGEDEPRTGKEVLSLDDDIISSLATQIVELYEKKTSVIYGIFRGTAKQFPTELKTYYDQKCSDDEFIGLTVRTMDSMQAAMKNTSGTGGYITFLQYTKNDVDYMLAVMIKNTKGFELQGLKPKEAIHVDTSKLYQAININVINFLLSLEKKEEDEVKSYISFISKANEPSGYFLDAFACKANVTPSKATIAAPSAARDFLKDCGIDKGELKSAYHAVVDLLIFHAEKPITISAIHRKVNEYLPEELYEEKKDDFLAFAKGEDYQIPDVFQAKGKTAKSLRQIKGTGDGWELHFDREMVGLKNKDVNKTFMYDSETKHLYMPTLPDTLIEKIEQELQIADKDDG